MYLRTSMLLVVLLGSACVIGEPDARQHEAQQDIGGGCDSWMCGSNSPQIAEFGFWELNIPASFGIPGLRNDAGLQLLWFEKGLGKYLPRVERGRLFAHPITSVPPYNVPLSGASLVDGALVLQRGARRFKIKVSATGEVETWARLPRGHVFLESYLLDWSEMAADGSYPRFQNMCSHPGGRDDTGMNGPLSFQTLLFEGDRIRADRKEVYGVDTSWFNLGCAGSALAKMALTGHNEAAKLSHTFTTSLAERQTILKMFTGDYCGDGTVFTIMGQPLNWADDRSTMLMPAVIASPPRPVMRESRWVPTGAACLDDARVDVAWTLLGEQTFGAGGKVYDQVLAHCPGLRPCDGATLDLDGYHLITATEPMPPPP